MRLRYSGDALVHLEHIFDFLTDRNPAAAIRILADIRAAAERLCDFPHIGRKGEYPDTHEWVVRGSPYLIVYEVDAAAAEIHVIGVFHGAQDRQEQLK
jgi:toxin ParE1/3/4